MAALITKLDDQDDTGRAGQVALRDWGATFKAHGRTPSPSRSQPVGRCLAPDVGRRAALVST